VSVGPPMHYDDVKDALYPDTADAEDFSYERVLRLVRLLEGERASSFSGTQGIETFSERVEPHSPGLADRLWYGAASMRSVVWAAEQGLNLLTSSVVRAEDSDDFDETQLAQVRAFRAHHPAGEAARVSQGLVVVPTDTATRDQRERYEAYAASRLPGPGSPRGRRG